jgi:hypothetical protein
MVDYEYYY